MGVKNKKIVNNDAVQLGDKRVEDLKCEQKLCNSKLCGLLIDFASIQDGITQVQKIKEISTYLKKLKALEKEDALCLSVIVECYFLALPRNPVKRALAGALQGSPVSFHDDITQCLSEQLLQLKDGSTSQQNGRMIVDNLAALLENFPLGERCVKENILLCFTILVDSLSSFTNLTGQASSVVEQNARMQDCLCSMQTLAKLLQRCSSQYMTSYETHSAVLEKHINMLYQQIYKIFTTESYLLDCKNVCGMLYPLILKLTCPENVVQIILHLMFRKCNLGSLEVYPIWLPDYPECLSSTLGTTAYLCLMNGVLAMLDVEHLVWGIDKEGHKHRLVDLIGESLFTLLYKLEDTNSKLTASRTLVMFTTRACKCVEAKNDEVFRSKFCGGSELQNQLLQVIWSHLEDPTDVIRYNARILFNNAIALHLKASMEDATSSEFVLGIAREVLSTCLSAKGKYGTLCELVHHIGTSKLLELKPGLPTELLGVMGEQTLSGHVSEVLERLFISHKQELKGQPNAGDLWGTVWVDPVLKALCASSKLHKTHIIEHVLPKLLKTSPDSMPFIINRLSKQYHGPGNLGALMSCLKRAKALGLFNIENIADDDVTIQESDVTTLSNDVTTAAEGVPCIQGAVTIQQLKAALCHKEDEVRIDVLGVLCENHKSTGIVSAKEMNLALVFFNNNMHSQSPAFRQSLVALTKKLLLRLRESCQVINREIKTKRLTSNVHLTQYKVFLEDFVSILFNQLHPRASFPRRTTSLSLLSLFVDVLTSSSSQELRLGEFNLKDAVTPARVCSLVECMSDTFESNKKEALNILCSLAESGTFQDVVYLSKVLQSGLQLSQSTKPQDSSTAAYLLKYFLHCDASWECIVKAHEEHVGAEKPEVNSFENRLLCLLEVLQRILGKQIQVARDNLLKAAGTGPMYPLLHCVRYILAELDFSYVKRWSHWKNAVNELIQQCTCITDIVSPVISDDSPEGNIPEEYTDACAIGEESESLLPEYLTVCCWRSVKEVSLLLGQLCQKAPIGEVDKQDIQSLLTVEQVHDIGKFFTTQLLESRHRGAFELAYAGFVQMTERLWKSPISDLYKLPRKWLDEIFEDIKTPNQNSRLCATRRSAGLPFYIQALVTTEPASTGRQSLKMMMSQLLALAQEDENVSISSEPKLHALNILRAMYRDTRLGEDVCPYIADGMKVAILGFQSDSWSIRNSSTLLFSAMMVRIFGVPRSKDAQSKKNCMTGRAFFYRFPSLFPFLLDQIDKATKDIGCGGEYRLHPSLYPVLMTLGRLLPSPQEGIDNSLNLGHFVPFVIKCASSPVYKTRMMAARALQPLLSKDQIKPVLARLLGSIPVTKQDLSGQNQLHGILIQLNAVLQNVEDVPPFLAADIITMVTTSVASVMWIVSRANPCPLTRTAFLSIISIVFKITSSKHDATKATHKPALSEPNHSKADADQSVILEDGKSEDVDINTLCVYIKKELMLVIHEDLQEEHPDADVLHNPGSVEFYEALTEITLDINKPLTPTAVNDEVVVAVESNIANGSILSDLLKFPLYEVRDRVLEYMEVILAEGSIKDLPDDIKEELAAMVLGREQYHECLIKVLNILVLCADIEKTKWQKCGSLLGPQQVLEYLICMANDHSIDDVRCAAHILSGRFISQVYNEIETDQTSPVLKEWLLMLSNKSCVEQTVDTRLATARVLNNNIRELLYDPNDKLGDSLWLSWNALILQLHDEDGDVKEVAASSVQYLNQIAVSDIKGTIYPIQANFALERAINLLVTLHGRSKFSGCFNTLSSWIESDIDPYLASLIQENEDRLFDKGELNSYMDNVIFVQISSQYLEVLLAMQTSSEPWEMTSLISNTNRINDVISIVGKTSKKCNETSGKMTKTHQASLECEQNIHLPENTSTQVGSKPESPVNGDHNNSRTCHKKTVSQHAANQSQMENNVSDLKVCDKGADSDCVLGDTPVSFHHPGSNSKQGLSARSTYKPLSVDNQFLLHTRLQQAVSNLQDQINCLINLETDQKTLASLMESLSYSDRCISVYRLMMLVKCLGEAAWLGPGCDHLAEVDLFTPLSSLVTTLANMDSVNALLDDTISQLLVTLGGVNT